MADHARKSRTSRTIYRLLRPVAALTAAWLLAPFQAASQDVHARSLVTTTEILEAMQNHQLPTTGVEVRLSIPITSAAAHPVLNIQAITPMNQHDIRLRMACRDPSLCLPFFATATYPEALDPAIFQLKSDTQPAANPKSFPTAAASPEKPAPSTSRKPLDPGTPPVVRSGAIATLDFDEEHIHVRLEVICLESGATGDKIRVTTRDHKQIYVAEIVAPNALKGTLTR